MATCCSINMRIFKSSQFFLLVLSLIWRIDCAPETSSLIRSALDSSGDVTAAPALGNHYDQRQNGTENYRIHLDGLVLVVAPIEGLLLAGGLPGATDIFGTPEGPIVVEKPQETQTTKPEVPQEKPAGGKSSRGPALRLMGLLAPFLRRIDPHQ